MQDAVSQNLTELLRQREECFVKIWECEQELKAILPDYPLPPPPDLPSRQKRKKPVAVKNVPDREASSACANMPFKIRDLEAGVENAYRLVYVYQGQEQSSFQTEASLANALANISTEDFRLLAIETVAFNDMDDWRKVQTIWSAPQEESNS